MTTAVGVLFVLVAYFRERGGAIDEIGLFNPSYMYLHYGKLSYPVHGFFDSMIVHPPVHYVLISLFMRVGLSLYYAEATPTLVMVLLCIWLIVRGPFPVPVKIGFLYGLWVSTAALLRFGMELFGMRPEGHLGAAWLASLLLLESGRLRNWNLTELFAGTFLMAYACSLHYYAAAGAIGVAVYVVWAAVSLRGKAWKALLAIVAGGLLYGVPYAVFYLLPKLSAILDFVKAAQGGGGVREVFQTHLDQYKVWAHYNIARFWLEGPISLGIPVVLLSTPILLALRSTRGIAIAALPLQLFLLLSARHKHGYYYLHEVAIYGAAVGAGVLTLVDLAVKNVKSPVARPLAWSAFGFWIALCFWNLNIRDGRLSVSIRPRVHEAEIARAAGREILGRNAVVASRIGPWFSSGAQHWYNPSLDVLWYPGSLSGFNLKAYFSHFDAVVENDHMSDSTRNVEHRALLSWYLDGTLRLRGFFFSVWNKDLTNLFFQANAPASITGFGLKDGKLYRFTEASTGDHEFVALVCAREVAGNFFYKPLSISMDLPQVDPTQPAQALVALLAPRDANHSNEPSIPNARLVQRVRGNLGLVDWRSMVKDLRSSDPPIVFYQKIDKIPGFTVRNLSTGPRI